MAQVPRILLASDVLIWTNSLSYPITMDLSRYLLIDVSTGTVLSAQHCVLVADQALTPSEWQELESFSDSEICDIGKQRGHKLTELI